MAATRKPPDRVPGAYLDPVRAFPLRPIRAVAENEEAIEVVARLAGRRERRDLAPAEVDYLDGLVGLIEQFEAAHRPIPPITGPATIRHLIDAKGINQAATAGGAGILESAFSEMLAGKRSLGVKHVHALAHFLAVPAGVLIGD